jgi:transcriptional regulator with XRE-family HTH domain
MLYCPADEGAQLSSLGTRLRRYRLDNGWSKRVVAKRLGVSAPSVVRWERGDATPNDYNRAKIERMLAGRARPKTQPAERPTMIELSLFPRIQPERSTHNR